MAGKTVTTSATASVETAPELATVRARAVDTSVSYRDACDHALDRAAALKDALSDVVAADQVRQTEITCTDSETEFYDTDDPYRATVSLAVDCSPDVAVDVTTTVTDTGGAVHEIAFGVTDETRHRLCNDVHERAVGRARNRASQIAATEDLVAGDVISIEQNDPGSFSDFVEESLTNWSELTLQPDPVKIAAEVTATFELVSQTP